MPRLFVSEPLQGGLELSLPPGPTRHVQVLRLQPGDELTLFDGRGGQWSARITRMGRGEVAVRVEQHEAVERELALPVTIALGMPANERMDWLVEKATELGAAAIQPLVCERSVLRLAGERARKKAEHWRGVAVAAAEQCGRTRLPRIEAPMPLPDWCRALPLAGKTSLRAVLSLQEAEPLAMLAGPFHDACFLSGPEGGLTPAEEALARERGFKPVSLGPRVLRAETAPLAALAWLGLPRA